nr:hypothetical protein [Tanacetum cinerariifolium]
MACSSKEEGSTSGVNTPTMFARGGTRSASGVITLTMCARGRTRSPSGVNTPTMSASGINAPTLSTIGGTRSFKGSKTSSVSSRGGKKSTSCDPALENLAGNSPTKSATNEAESRGLRPINGKVVRSRGRGDGLRSRMYPNEIRPIGYDVSSDPIDGDIMLGLKDVRIHVASQSQSQAVVPLTESQPLTSQEPLQEQEPVQEHIPMKHKLV